MSEEKQSRSAAEIVTSLRAESAQHVRGGSEGPQYYAGAESRIAPLYRVFSDGVDYAWIDTRPADDARAPRPTLYRATSGEDLPAGEWMELFADEMAMAFYVANEQLGESLVGINLALGLPASTPARVTAARAAELRGHLGPHPHQVRTVTRGADGRDVFGPYRSCETCAPGRTSL